MACGTPVIATALRFPEIVDHGRTGVIVDKYREMEDPVVLELRTRSTRRCSGARSRSGSRPSTWSRTTSPRTRRRSPRALPRRSPRSPYDREILWLALPALGALAAEPLYLLVDTAIVGHLGRLQLAALGIASVVLGGAFAVFNFLQYGTTAQVARAGGAGQAETARRLGAQALWLSLAFGIGRLGADRASSRSRSSRSSAERARQVSMQSLTSGSRRSVSRPRSWRSAARATCAASRTCGRRSSSSSRGTS